MQQVLFKFVITPSAKILCVILAFFFVSIKVCVIRIVYGTWVYKTKNEATIQASTSSASMILLKP